MPSRQPTECELNSIFWGSLSHSVLLELLQLIFKNIIYIFFLLSFYPMDILCIYDGFQFSIFIHETQECTNKWVSVSCDFSSTLFLLFACFAQFYVLIFLSSDYIVSYYYPLQACLSSNERLREGRSGWVVGRETSRSRRKETIIWICHMRKKFYF